MREVNRTRVVDSERFAVDIVSYAGSRGEVVRPLVDHPGVAAVVALTNANEVVLIRNSRPNIEIPLWELPAGTMERSEQPIDAARRELREETGFLARTLVPIRSIYTTPGTSNEVVHLFLARDLKHGTSAPDPIESITVQTMPMQAAVQMIWDGQIVDAKTIAGLLLGAHITAVAEGRER